MKRFSLIYIILLSLPAQSLAEWAWIPLKDLISDSDLIVVGTLSSVNGYSKDGTDYGQGVITVDETIWGAVNPGEALTLKWDNPSEIVCPRVEHRPHTEKKGIWLLKLSSDREMPAAPTLFASRSEDSSEGMIASSISILQSAPSGITLAK